MDYKEKFKTHDLQVKETGDIILCTGNIVLLRNRHGLVIETEEDYSNLEFNEKIPELDDFLFENKIAVSIGSFDRNIDFIKRVRPSGFISKSCNNKNASFNIAIETFIQRNKDRLDSHKLRNLNTRGGITVAHGDIGALFDLKDAPILSINKGEVVKRLKIGYDMLTELNKSSELSKELFDQIEEEMSELGCPYFTFSRPDEGVILRRDEEFSEYVEIRAYGLEKSNE